jgi:hypothetical protein
MSVDDHVPEVREGIDVAMLSALIQRPDRDRPPSCAPRSDNAAVDQTGATGEWKNRVHP